MTHIGLGSSSLCGRALHINLTQRPSRRVVRNTIVVTQRQDQNESENLALQEDPQAPYHRYGRRFGQRYLFQDVVDTAPRVRIRRAKDRAVNQLADLAVLNERLALQDEAEASAVRRRVDYLRRRSRTWELIYEHVTRKDALFTLSAIEEANRRVEEALDEGARERVGIGALKKQLQELQSEVATAHSRLHVTQARVEVNLQRIAELKDEARRLEDAHDNTGGDDYVGTPTSTLSTSSIRTASNSSSSSSITSSTAPSKHQQQFMHPRTNTFSKKQRSTSTSRGLDSSLDLEDELKNHWYAIQFTSHLKKDTLLPFELFDQPWVLFRGKDGVAACVRDECAHRACPLSLGSVVDGEVSCPYHGWKFDGSGNCTAMPSTAYCRGVSVSALPVVEIDGLVYVWPGWKKPSLPPVGAAAPPKGYQVHAEIELEVPVEHGLLLENLLDLAHAPFTHTTTFAKGWPVPEAVRFHAARVLSGSWQPYPIDMAFGPPCMVFSTIGLAQPGRIERGARASDCANHLHQMHVCLPAKRGHTRLLYRMSMDFMGWTRYIPGIAKFWESIARQVLGEDLVLVQGQQRNMVRGSGQAWINPVSYDKLGVRYRRWRNAVARGESTIAGVVEGSGDGGKGADGSSALSSPASTLSSFSMDAGQVFSVDEDDVYLDSS